MRNDTRAVEIRHIIQELASLRGGESVEITTTRWPRFGPAEPGTNYRVQKQRFAVQQIAESFEVPDGGDEIVIRLTGALEEPQARDDLLDQLNSFFTDESMKEHWDLRTRIKNGGPDKPTYEFTVLSHLPAATTPVDLM